MPALLRQNDEATADVVPLAHDELRARFTEWLAAYRELEASGTPVGSGTGSDTDSDHELPADDDFPDYLDSMQAYLEFIILQRNCAASRAHHGLPPAQCSRGDPCNRCRSHDGSHVTAVHWHVMSDADVERHLQEYMRIRDALPPWQSTCPVVPRPGTSVAPGLAGALHENMRAVERVTEAYWARYLTDYTHTAPNAEDTDGSSADEDSVPALESPSEWASPTRESVLRSSFAAYWVRNSADCTHTAPNADGTDGSLADEDSIPALESPNEWTSPVRESSFEDTRGLPALESPTRGTSPPPHQLAHAYDFIRSHGVNLRDLERELREL